MSTALLIIIAGFALFAVSIILIFVSGSSREKQRSHALHKEVLAQNKAFVDKINDTFNQHRVFQNELKNSLQHLLSEYKSFKNELHQHRLVEDSFKAREEAIIKERDMLKGKIGPLTKAINDQKNDVQSAINSLRNALQSASDEKNAQLEVLEKESQEAKKQIASCWQDIEAGRKVLNNALNQNKIFNYKLKEDLQVILSENEKFKDELHQQRLAADKFRAREEAALKKEIEQFAKEINDQKDAFQSASGKIYIQLKAFERELQKAKMQTTSGSQNIEEMKKTLVDSVIKNKVFHDEIKKETERFAKKINYQRDTFQSSLDEKYAQLDTFVKELQKVKLQLITFVSYSRDIKDWAGDIQKAETELFKIRTDVFKQEKMIGDTRKKIKEIKRNNKDF